MAAIKITPFLGEAPIIAPELLPAGMATAAVNCNLVSGDLNGYDDIGNPYQLAKTATINSLYLEYVSASSYWYQWKTTELGLAATNVDVATGAIPGDTTGHVFITGLDVPRQTNFFYATDPSQQGSNTLHAYPYQTFPIGIDNPTAAPTAAQPTITGTATNFDYAQEASVNSLVVSSAGSAYAVGDTVTIPGGTVAGGLYAATAKITTIDASGSVTGIERLTGGFYTAGNGPTFPCSPTGGSGSGLTVTGTNATQNSTGFAFTAYNNGSGSYRAFAIVANQWSITTGQGDLAVAYSNGAFNINTATSAIFQVDATSINNGSGAGPDIVFEIAGTYDGTKNVSGPTVVLSMSSGSNTLKLYNTITGSNGGAVSGTVLDSAGPSAGSFALGTKYRIKWVCTQQTNASTPGFNVTVTVAAAATPTSILATVTGFVEYNGEVIGVGTNHRGTHSDGNDARFENIYIQTTQPASEVTQESVNYVTTVENLFSQESGPSDPSQTINIFIDGTTSPVSISPVSISIPPSSNSAYLTNLYRAVDLGNANEAYEIDNTFAAMYVSTSQDYDVGETVIGLTSAETGTVVSWSSGILVLKDVTGVFTLYENIRGGTSSATGEFTGSALGDVTITYTDTVLDENLGAALVSTDWAPPPTNSQGIVSAANGITSVFSGNLLCLSAPRYPHSYPVGNQYPTDDPIIATAVIGTQFVVFTSGYTYTAYGDDPAAFTMQKETSPQACVSKRSVSLHRTAGVIFASANGLARYLGPGEIDLLRVPDDEKKLKPIFSIDQWKALNPSSIIGIVHDDYYFFWYDNGTEKAGYIVDLSHSRSAYATPGFGIVKMDFHVTCAFVDKSTDTLWLVPDKSVYAINGSVVSSALNVVSQWEYANTQRMKTWERDTIILPRPFEFSQLRVRAQDYNSVMLTVATETGTLFNGSIPSGRAFLVASKPGINLSISQSGTSRVYSIELAEAIEDLLS